MGIKGKEGAEAPGYATGCISTKGKFAFRYGKLEVRAWFSGGQGSWPAIWLMPQEGVYGGWPQSGEIDVMEHLNRSEEHTSELQSLMSNSYAVFCLKQKKTRQQTNSTIKQ